MSRGGVSNIGYDECLSSWISRNSKHFDVEAIDAYLTSGSDLDFDLAAPPALRLFTMSGLNPDRLGTFFRASTDWLLPWESRMAYCCDCLLEDVKAGRAPAWRKDWCYLHCPICVRHKQMLSIGAPTSICLNKSWVAFFAECRGEWRGETRCLLPWRQSRAEKKAILLALRVQGLLTLAHKKRFIALPGGGGSVSSNDFLRFSKFLLDEFLLPRRRGLSSDGVARITQSGLPRLDRGMTLQEAINAGAADCNAFCRVVALVLVGCVFRLFPPARFMNSRESLQLCITVRDGSPERIARYGIRTSRQHAAWIVELLLEGSSIEFKKRVSEFVAEL